MQPNSVSIPSTGLPRDRTKTEHQSLLMITKQNQSSETRKDIREGTGFYSPGAYKL